MQTFRKLQFIDNLTPVARRMMTIPKGLLAADERPQSIGKRFATYNIPNTEETRSAYREMMLQTKGLGEYISGVILSEDIFYDTDHFSKPLLEYAKEQNILLGVKLDDGTEALEGTHEVYTKGIENIEDKVERAHKAGAHFAKWRSVFTIQNGMPSTKALEVNLTALAEYAAACQSVGIVPIVEPEVLWEGDYSIQVCSEVVGHILNELFKKLYAQRIIFSGMIVKGSMVCAGKSSLTRSDKVDVAQYTLETYLNAIPHSLGGVMFLSGGHDRNETLKYFDSISCEVYDSRSPVPFSFSFGRSLQNIALSIWKGKKENISRAQDALLGDAYATASARRCSVYKN